MSRKIFLSVLGTSQYGPCKYVLPDGSWQSDEVSYIQEAMLQMLKPQLTANDAAYIFLTEGSFGSLQRNWANDGWTNRDTGEPLSNEGLESRLKKLELPCEVVPVIIPDGNNEKEIWEVFSSMFEVMESDDRIFFDITHGFRYLPMLGMVLLNYAKFLNDITVDQITYGNYEGRDRVKNEAPIVDLTSFSLLQDWTSAASEFLNNGNASSIESLTLKQVTPVLSASKGKDVDAANLRDFAKGLRSFSNKIITGRSKSIYSGSQVKYLMEKAESVKADLIAPMAPIVEKTKNKVAGFKSNGNVDNGFAAVNWCIDNNLIQQAYSLLLETTITSVLINRGIEYYWDRDQREIVSSAFTILSNKIPEKDWNLICQKNSNFVQGLLDNDYVRELRDSYAGLSIYRNDLLHAGTKKESIESEDAFRRKIMEYRDNIFKVYTEKN